MAIAQLNVAWRKYDLDDPKFADFMDNLDRINTLGERSDGFIWRLKNDDGHSMDIPVSGDPLLVSNLSVWESVEHLCAFAFRTIHKQFYNRKDEWFDPSGKAQFVMWNVEADAQPTLAQAMERLKHLNINGPSPFAFGWVDGKTYQK